MTITPDAPVQLGIDCPTMPIRIAADQVAAVVGAPLCLCGHARASHPGAACRCCDGECTAYRPRAGRRVAAALELAHELRAIAPAEVPTITVGRRRFCSGRLRRGR